VKALMMCLLLLFPSALACGKDAGATYLSGIFTQVLEPHEAYRADAAWLLEPVQPWADPLRIYHPPTWNLTVQDDVLRISSKDGALFGFEEAYRSKLERLPQRNWLEVAYDVLTGALGKNAKLLCQDAQRRFILGGNGMTQIVFVAATAGDKTAVVMVYASMNSKQTVVYTSTALMLAPSRAFADLARRVFAPFYAQIFWNLENCLPGQDTDRDRVQDCLDNFPRDPLRK
jgi:hypothetical protein